MSDLANRLDNYDMRTGGPSSLLSEVSERLRANERDAAEIVAELTPSVREQPCPYCGEWRNHKGTCRWSQMHGGDPRLKALAAARRIAGEN